MNVASDAGRRMPPKWLTASALVGVAAVGLAACGGSSSSTKAASPTTTAGSPGTTGGASSAPGTMFSAANVPGIGTVVVDGQGRTVYLLTGSQKNLPCDDASGCTKVWPDLALPDGTSAATAGPGLQQSLLGTMKLSSGETYPTYGGYLMYEFTGDSGPGQGAGQGIKSFGGTWYALTPAGTPVGTAAAGSSTNSTSKSSSGGGY
jgi:predicted lipoprotein with Yx(FWY)xxD motif